MVHRSLAMVLVLGLVAVVGSPGIAALCAGSPAARAHACCAAGSDCDRFTPPAQMRCCEAAPIQAPAGSRQGVLSNSGAQSAAALPAAAQVLAGAAVPGRDARSASLASFPESLSTLSSPLRL
jgi:hypothetical protein